MLIRLTASHAGPTDAKVWINTDKIVELSLGGNSGVTRILMEPADATGGMHHVDVEEAPQKIAQLEQQAHGISDLAMEVARLVEAQAHV